MASSNKNSLTSNDPSTDTDDDIQYDSDSPKDQSLNTNEDPSTTNNLSSRTKRLNNKMKPCLVQRTSTSDEELQHHLMTARINEQPTHGILKVPSGKMKLDH